MSASAFSLFSSIFSHQHIVSKGGADPPPFPFTGNVSFNTKLEHNKKSGLRVSADLSNDVSLYSFKNCVCSYHHLKYIGLNFHLKASVLFCTTNMSIVLLEMAAYFVYFGEKFYQMPTIGFLSENSMKNVSSSAFSS